MIVHGRLNSRRGYTLLEIIIGLAMMGIVLLATHSTVMIASRAVPDGRSKASSLLGASRALDTMTGELGFATSISAMTATKICFTVADRTGDSAPETICYEWTAKGQPLTRQLNGGSAVAIANDVQAFDLSYGRRAVQLPVTYSEGAETEIASHDGVLSLGTFSVQDHNWVGECFTPSLPANAVSWRMTRLKVKARTAGPATGQALVQVRTSVGSEPTGAIVDQTILFESSLTSSYAWVEVPFSYAGGLSPSSPACITLQWISGAESCEVQCRSLLGAIGGINRVTSTSDGLSWSAQTLNNMLFFAYGRITVANAAATKQLLTDVRVTLRCGADASAAIKGTVAMLNEPEVAAP